MAEDEKQCCRNIDRNKTSINRLIQRSFKTPSGKSKSWTLPGCPTLETEGRDCQMDCGLEISAPDAASRAHVFLTSSGSMCNTTQAWANCPPSSYSCARSCSARGARGSPGLRSAAGGWPVGVGASPLSARAWGMSLQPGSRLAARARGVLVPTRGLSRLEVAHAVPGDMSTFLPTSSTRT